MSILKSKGDALYQKMKMSREALVKKYEAAGTIRYDQALGMVGGTVETAEVGLAGTATVNGQTITTITYKTVVYNVTKRVNRYEEDAVRVDDAIGTITTSTGNSETNVSVPDLVGIKAYNIARGVASGTMLDALKKFATGKTVLLDSNDAGLDQGFVILEEVECLLRVMSDIKVAHMAPSRVGGATLGLPASGVVHAVPGKVEVNVMRYRGTFKWVNYRTIGELMKDPVSIFSIVDKSRQSIALFGPNSLIRMWGANQVIDLNGFRISQHERPARFAGFQALIDLSDGHFSALSSKAARNAFIYSSKGKGVLGRSNHFWIRGHGVKGLLVENVQFGLKEFFNEGSYFGNMLNDSDEVVVKDCHAVMSNKAVSLSSQGLVWYNQLQLHEILMGKYETTTTFGAGTNYPWLKWEAITAGTADTFGNGKKTAYPVIKSQAELATALGANSAAAPALAEALDAAKLAYRKSQKHADDMYIQVHSVSGRNFLGSLAGTLMNDPAMIHRTTNAVASNPKNPDGVRYPDSTWYSFRVGSAEEGVGKLAQQRGGSVSDIFITDSSFEVAHMSPMEATGLGIVGKGVAKGFNGMGLRPFGYTNSNSKAQGIASSLVLMSKELMEEVSPGLKLEDKTVDAFDTAAKAVANAPLAGWTAKKAHGLYKGNDIIEASLATLHAVQLLKKYFTAAGPAAVLSGADNSLVDLGVLALRKTMMAALSAKTAAHVGLKGGYNGDLFDLAQEMEIYPFLVSSDGTISIDKDTEWTVQQDGNVNTPAQITANRTLSQGYFGAKLPAISDSIYKLKLISKDTMALVTGDTETPVTYQMCADLLGYTATSAGTPAVMSAPVEYKLIRNIDGQGHTHKGAFGIRVDEASSILIKNVVIRDIETADAGKLLQSLGSVEQQIAFGVNAEQRPESGALDIHGISLNGVTEAHIEDVIVGVSHAGGSIFGIEVAGKSSEITIENVEIDAIEASEGGALAQPFGEQKAIGVRVVKGSKDVKVSKVRAGEILAAHSGLAKVVEIEDAEGTLG